MKIKLLLPFLFLLIIFTFFLINSNSPKFEFVNKYPNTDLDNTYYLLWKHKNDENTDTFLKTIQKLAKEKNVNKIYTQELNLQDQLTTLFYFENGELVSRIRSDQSLEELEAFFNKSTFTITEGKFGKVQYKDFTFVIKDIVVSNALSSKQQNNENIDENRYILTIKYYVYNNSDNIYSDINDQVTDILKSNINFYDTGNNIDPIGVLSTVNPPNLYRGDRAKGIISFELPIDSLNSISMKMAQNQSLHPLSSVKFEEILEYDNFDF